MCGHDVAMTDSCVDMLLLLARECGHAVAISNWCVSVLLLAIFRKTFLLLKSQLF